MDKPTNGEVLLRTQLFGGFEKAQVLAYIDELRENNRKAESELNAKISAVSQTRDELSSSVAQFESQIKTLELQLEGKKEKIKELTGVIHSLGDELSRQKEAVALKEGEIAAQKEANRQLAAKAEESIEKARRYNEISSQVGTIIIEARRSASEIITAAKAASESSHRDLLLAAKHMADEMTGFRADVVKMRAAMAHMNESINGRIGAIEDAAGELEKRLANVVVCEVSGEPSDAAAGSDGTSGDEDAQTEPDTNADAIKAVSEDEPAGWSGVESDGIPQPSPEWHKSSEQIRSPNISPPLRRGFIGNGSFFRQR